MSDDSIKVRQYTNEVLQQFGSKEVFRGTVAALDDAQTTVWIKLEGEDRLYLAFCKDDRGVQFLFVGQTVEFRISGMRAMDVQVVGEPPVA